MCPRKERPIKIERYAFGKITIDGQTYSKDIIILPDQVWDGWWREQGHNLCMADLEKALAAKPQILIVGTGYFGLMQVPEQTQKGVLEQGVQEVVVANTRQAVEKYNTLTADNQVVAARRIVAALHLSC